MNNVNFIVSGLERSGTSMMMQMLDRGGVRTAFDNSRAADAHNPRGYYELAGGKIINRLIEGNFDFQAYQGQVVKVTAYGLKFLPAGPQYRIVYMTRNLEEILKSMEKMSAKIDWTKDRTLFGKLNKFSLDLMESRKDIDYTIIEYRDVIDNSREAAERVAVFFDVPLDIDRATQAVDAKLYRNRASL